MKCILLILAILITIQVRAEDTVIGNLVAVERKITVNLSDCEKTWNKILADCWVVTSEKGTATDFTLPGQENFQRYVVNEQGCGVGMSSVSHPNGWQAYHIRYVGTGTGRVPFAVARPCLDRALQEAGGVIASKVFIVK